MLRASPSPAAGIRAAQYIRMSSEHQRYSIEYQTAAIAAYALDRGMTVIETYSDAAISGLHIARRSALKALLSDVLSGAAGFSTILTYDVSRWGRFQDPDEAAHYEFICKQAGVNIEYCAELFENDGSLTSTLVKSLKRAMAAEYSRELGVRVSLACHGLAAQGYRLSGSPGYGLRRMMLDADNRPVGLLAQGERKAIQGYRIMLTPGPATEVAIVRRIYRSYVSDGQTLVAIARMLNNEGIVAARGAWTRVSVRAVLTNERYIGNNVYGRWNSRLGSRGHVRRPETWTRCNGAFPALINPRLFAKVAKMLSDRTVELTDAAMLDLLNTLLTQKGFLCARLVNDSPRLPCVSIYAKRFGSLTNAYAQIGYDREAALRQRHRDQSDTELLRRLKKLLAQRGALSAHMINAVHDMPGAETYIARFGGLAEAYRRIGYDPTGAGPDRPRRDPMFSDAAMIDGLRALLAREGRITAQLIDDDRRIPSRMTYVRRFGSQRRLYGLVDYPYQPHGCAGRPRGAGGRLRPGAGSLV